MSEDDKEWAFNEAIRLANARKRRREEQGQHYFVDLQKNEQLVAQNAAQIFAGYAAAGQITDENEEDMINKSVIAAVKIAYRVESWVTEKDEQVDDFI